MTRNERAKIVLQQLKKEYPTVETPLNHSNVFELLVATILSPQTPDETTNKVTPELFQSYPTPLDLSKAGERQILDLIRRVNYNKTKSKNLINAAGILVSDFESNVPHELENLTKLPGVGRKVANVVISEWYAKRPNPGDTRSDEFNTVPRGSILPEGFVVDTHVLRVSKMMGLTDSTDPKKVEQDLMQLFPREEWNDMSLRFIFHGREWNQAKNPKYAEHPFWSEYYKNL